MSDYPPPTTTLDEWLQLSKNEIAKMVSERHLAVLLSIDGTRRHYLLSQAKENSGSLEISDKDFEDFANHTSAAYVRVYNLLFSVGIDTVLTPVFFPPNFKRDSNYVEQALAASKRIFLGTEFVELYRKWELQTRIYGDFDLAPLACQVQNTIFSLAEELKKLTSNTHGNDSKRLLFGYNAGTFVRETSSRTVLLYNNSGSIPDEQELRLACFPDGPDKIDLVIGSGWLRVGAILPPVLDNGNTDIYNVSNLVLDLEEHTLRCILYDRIFRRWAAPEDDTTYNLDDLALLKHYYTVHKRCSIGVGELIGSASLWYPEHLHKDDEKIV